MEQTLAEGRGLEHLAMPTDEQVLLVASFPRNLPQLGVLEEVSTTWKLQKSFSKLALAMYYTSISMKHM